MSPCQSRVSRAVASASVWSRRETTPTPLDGERRSSSATVDGGRYALSGRRQPSQRQRGEQEPEVAQRHVVIVAQHEQVDDDPAQPRGDEIATPLRPNGDDEAG